MIYTVDEIQNPLSHTTMLFESDTNSTGGRNHVFPNSYGLASAIDSTFMEGEGAQNCHFCSENRTGEENS